MYAWAWGLSHTETVVYNLVFPTFYMLLYAEFIRLLEMGELGDKIEMTNYNDDVPLSLC